MTAEVVTFGTLLRHYRVAAGLSQEALAERAGLSPQAVSALERGLRRAPRLETVRVLSVALALHTRQAAALEQAVERRRGARPLSGAVLPGLSVAATPLVGRDHDTAVVAYLLRQSAMPSGVRLLTLSGPGGVGKTRLAVQAAVEAAAAFADGVVAVDLAPLRDPALVAATIAGRLDVRENGMESPSQRLAAHLREKRLLLLLDNFEQVAAARDLVSDLLIACPHLTMLVTSRAALQVRGEQEYSVVPLALPTPRQEQPDILMQYAAVQLFVQRAQQIKPDLALTPATATAVAEICRRLDGLPLAIELAAALVRLVSPRAMVERMGGLPAPAVVSVMDGPDSVMSPPRQGSLDVLTAGAWDLPDRHQTMRHAIAWSYDLLEPAAQALFPRLAVFAGTATREAIEAVCHPRGVPGTLGATLRALVQTSLVESRGGTDGSPGSPGSPNAPALPRYTMLETIRAYALERLVASGEAAALRQRHAEYYLALAEQAEPALTTTEQGTWAAVLERELDNIRAALQWARESGRVEDGLRLAGALRRFWERHGHLGEGRVWLEALLAVAPADMRASKGEGRAKALNAAGILAYRQGDFACAVARQEENLALRREQGDRRGVASSLANLGNVALHQGDHAHAVTLYEQSLALSRAVGDTWSIASTLNNLGEATRYHADHGRAQEFYEQSLALYTEVGDTWSVASVLSNLGELACARGDYVRAAALSEQSLVLSRRIGDKRSIASVLHNLGNVASYQGDHEQAMARYRESLTLVRQMDDKVGVARCLEGVAGVAAARGQGQQAARLYGAAATLRAALGAPLPPAEQGHHDRAVAAVRAALGDDAFAAAWAAGWRLSPAQAIDAIDAIDATAGLQPARTSTRD